MIWFSIGERNMESLSTSVNLGGIPTEIYLKDIEINNITLDEDNPRIGFQRDAQPFQNVDQRQIAFALSNKSPDAYNKLKTNIEINEGIVNPIWVEPISDEMFLVIEGNTRLLIYRELHEKYPHKEIYKKIPCRILPHESNSDQRDFIRLESHLRGATPWEAYEKARYLFHLWDRGGYSFSQLSERTKLSEKEITQSIQAFKDMEQQYLPKYGTNPNESLKFSYFVEYEKNSKLKHEMERNGFLIADFCDWIGEKKIPKAQDVRELRYILENDESKCVFEKDGFEYAKDILGTIKPDLVAPLYQNIEKVRDDLKNLSNYEIVEMQDGNQPMKKEIILKLHKELTDFVKRYF